MRGRSLPVSLVLLTILAPTVAATHTTPSGGGNNPDWIESDVRIDVGPALRTLHVNVTLDVHKTFDGVTLTAQDLRTAYNSPAGEESTVIQNVKARLDAAFQDSIEQMFPDVPDENRTFQPVTLDAASFEPTTTGNDYSPPVTFENGVSLRLPDSRTGFSYGRTEIDAILGAGAEVQVDHTFHAPAGYLNTFHVTLPEGRAWTAFEQGTISSDGRTATVVVDAVDTGDRVLGADPSPLTSRVGDPVADAPTQASEATTIVLTFQEFRAGVPGLPLLVDAVNEVESISTAEKFPGALPDVVHLPYVGADGIRRLHEAGVLADEDIDRALENVSRDVADQLEATLGDNVTLVTDVDEASLAPTATGPVRFTAFAEAVRDVGDVDPEVAEAVLEGGAGVLVDFTLRPVGNATTTYRLAGPTGLALVDVTPATYAVDGGVTAVLVPGVHDALHVNATLRDPDATILTEEDVDVTVSVDLHDWEGTLSGIAGGDPGALLVNVDVAVDLAVVEVPGEVRDDLPDRVILTHVSADTLRRLRALGELDDAALADLEATFLEQVTGAVGDLAPGIPVTGGVDDATLAEGTARPVRLDAHLSFRQPLIGGAPEATAGFVLYTITHELPLQSIEGLPTTYEVLLPRGLEVVSVDAPGAEAEDFTRDGRSGTRITVPEGASTTAAMGIGLTPTLLWAEFPLLVVGLVAVALLLAAGPALLVARMVRNRRRRREGEE